MTTEDEEKTATEVIEEVEEMREQENSTSAKEGKCGRCGENLNVNMSDDLEFDWIKVLCGECGQMNDVSIIRLNRRENNNV